MKKRYLTTVWTLPALLMCLTPPVQAEDEKDQGLTEVAASQCLSVRRGTEEAVKEEGIHAKNLSPKTKHRLDRFAMIRFDSGDFGKPVQGAGLRLRPFKYDHEEFESMRFRVYGIKDGDKEDEKFEEKTYDPLAEDTILDRRIANMLDRKQVALLGTFKTVENENVLFSSRGLLTFLRQDTNGTVTLVLVRETESGLNSRFSSAHSQTPPTLMMRLSEQAPSTEEQPEEEPAEQAQDNPAVQAE